MSDLPRRPRVILEEAEPPVPAAPRPRIDFRWEQAVAAIAPKARGWSALSLMAGGIGVLVLGLGVLEALNYVADQFGRSWLLGLITLGVVVAGFGLIFWGVIRELRALFALREVDRARAAFAKRELDLARHEAIRWVRGLPQRPDVLPALREARDIDALRAVLEGGPIAALDAQSAALGRSAAVQAFAITAVSPSPGLDAIVFAWRGVRLVRQVASLHGLRPGFAATLALLRRTAIDAGAVAATDIAVDAAARALLSSPLLQHVAGETAAGAVAARRMLLLARAASQACRILPRR